MKIDLVVYMQSHGFTCHLAPDEFRIEIVLEGELGTYITRIKPSLVAVQQFINLA